MAGSNALATVVADLGVRHGWVLVIGDLDLDDRAALEQSGLTPVLAGVPATEDPGPILARVELAEPAGRAAALVITDPGGWPLPAAGLAPLASALAQRLGIAVLVTDLVARTPLDTLTAAGRGLVPAAQLHEALAGAGFAVEHGIDEARRAPDPAGHRVGGGGWADALAGRRHGPGWAGRYVRGWRRLLHGGPSGGPWLSVAVRTQARRPELLREALLCLAAQTDPDLDVLLMVHDAEPAGMSAIAEILDEHHPSFASRVRVLPVRGGGRSRPLNAALAAARGDYVAFLDDDDLVTANWVETFRAGAAAAPGRIVRARTAVQEVAAPRPGDLAPYRVRSAFRTPYAASFDLAEHLVDNQSPICSLALPRAQLDTWAIRFDDSLSSHEDWDVLLRLGAAAGVESCPEVTSIYHVWAAGGSAALVGQPGWVAAQRAVVARLADSGLVVHPDLAASLLAAPRRAAQAEVALAAVEREDPGAVPPQPTEVGRARRRGGGVRRRRG